MRGQTKNRTLSEQHAEHERQAPNPQSNAPERVVIGVWLRNRLERVRNARGSIFAEC